MFIDCFTFQNLESSLKRGEPILHTSLKSLGEMALHFPSLFETKHKAIVREFVVKELLMKDMVSLNLDLRKSVSK